MTLKGPVLGSPRPFAEAYRRDAERTAMEMPFGASDGVWVQVGSLVQHGARAADDAREAPLVAARHLAAAWLRATGGLERPALDPTDSPAGQDDAIRLIAEDAENAGAFHVAADLLEALGAVTDEETLDAGRITAHAARVAWKVGALDRADRLYRRVERLGRALRSDELLVRGWIGKAVLAQLRGNLPGVIRWGRRGYTLARKRGFHRLGVLAGTTVMVAHAKARQFDQALHLGWTLYGVVEGDPGEEAAVLGNLGQMLCDAGELQGASAAFHAVLVRTHLPRVLLPALGGFASVNAALRRPALVEWAAGEVRRVAPLSSLPYESATALLDCAVALEHIGRSAVGEPMRREAERLAAQHGYHEIAYRSEIALIAAAERAARTAAATSRTAVRKVAAAVTELEPNELPRHVRLAAVEA